MYLYFENWSHWAGQLDKKGLSHVGIIIKALSLPVDPRVKLNKPELKIIEVDGRAPLDGIYKYPDRGGFSGSEMEEMLKSLPELTVESIRSLFRFANSPEIESCQIAMSLKKPDDTWVINHPMEEIDGLTTALRHPEVIKLQAHLDLFNPVTISKLDKIMDISSNSNELLKGAEGLMLRKDVLQEFNLNNRLERK